MKTIILYSSKTGVTEDCAKSLANLLNVQDCFDLSNKALPSIQDYDQIIMGTSIYAGMVRRPFKKFIAINHSLLMTKKISLFTCGANDKINPIHDLVSSIPSDVLNHFEHIGYFGWEAREEKLGFFGKFVLKKIQEKENIVPSIHHEALNQFAILCQ